MTPARKFMALCLSIGLSPLLAQSNMVMMNPVADNPIKTTNTETTVDDASAELEAMKLEMMKEKAALYDKIDSLESVVITLKQKVNALETENQTLEEHNLEITQTSLESKRETTQVAEEEFSLSSKPAGNFKNCIEATSYQPLFTERILVAFDVSANGKSFTGQLQYAYVPEIGKKEGRVQEIKGVYKKTDDCVQLDITSIDGMKTSITLYVHDKSYRSYFKAGETAAVLPYTKVVHFEEMMLSQCIL